MKHIAFLAAALAFHPVGAALVASGTYDEQTVQANAVDFSMTYNNSATWTTGIGQTLGSAQIRTVAEFKPLVENAFLSGNGGVITFDEANPQNYSQIQSFAVSFAGGAKQMTLTNHPTNSGSYSIGGVSGNRTAISGSNMLGRNGNGNFDFEFGGFSGFGPNEKITAIAVTILGRNGASATSNWRVIAFYTNGVDTGSSSTLRTINTGTGNATHDSFSGIVAPAGHWITRMRINSDNGQFTSIDDLAFITSDILAAAPEIATALAPSYEPYLGDSLTLGVSLQPGASPPPGYQWYLNDIPIEASLGGNDPNLVILGGPGADGTYKVVISNSAGSAESSTTVTHSTDPALADWFRSYRFRVLDTRGGGNTLQISEFVLTRGDAALPGGITTNPGGNNPANEQPANARDGDTATKWLDFNKQPLVVTFPNRQPLEDYRFATANDATERDPVSWFLEGSNDGFTWVPLHAVFQHPTPADRLTYTTPFLLPANRADIDADGMDDAWEILYFGNLRQSPDADFDNDGASNLQEFQTAQGLLLQRDASGTISGLSPFSGSSDPVNPDSQPDSDNNGLPDPWERRYFATIGQNPNADADGDGLSNLQELLAGTDPTLADSDGDGISDGQEISAGTNPLWATTLREWRPGGLPSNGGLWDATVPNWYDGHSATPDFQPWSPGLTARFSGNLSSTTIVELASAITGIQGMHFTHSGADWTLQNGSLAFAEPSIRLAGHDARIDSQIISPSGLDIRAAGGALLLGGDHSATLAGIVTVHPDASLDPIAGDTALGTASLQILEGAQLRLFSPSFVFYTQPLTIAGFGNARRADGAGAIRGGGGNHLREWDEPILLAADAGIRLEAGQRLFANGGILRAAGRDATSLTLALDPNAVLDTFETLDLGTGGLLISPLPGPGGASTGGTVILGSPDNAFASVFISQGTLRADVQGALPDGIPVTLNGGTIRLNSPFSQSLASITGSGGTFDAGDASLSTSILGGTGGAVSIGAGSFTLAMTADITTGRMIRTTNVPGSLFTKTGPHRLTLTGTDNRGGGANGNWVIEQGILNLAAEQPQFGTIRDGGTITVRDGASVLVSNFNALHGWEGGGTHYVLEAGASMTTGPEITTRATRITLKGGELAADTPNPVFGSYDLFGNSAERRIIADGGPVTSVISAQDLRLTTPAGYLFETVAGSPPSGIDLDVTGSLNGPHGFVKLGDGVMRLGPATHGHQGSTTASAGTLRIDGTLTASAVTVQPAATLSGSGSIPAATIQGTLALDAGHTLAIRGLLTLEDATLSITGTPAGSSPVLLATYGSLAGSFATITGVPAGWTLDPTHAGGTAIALVSGADQNYTSWAAANGIAGEPFDGDFDHDGLSNGLEYALAGLNPAAPDAPPGTFANGTLTFTKRPEAVANGDVSYAIETSTTLQPGSWTTVTPDVNDASTLSHTLPTGQGKIFARLVVTGRP